MTLAMSKVNGGFPKLGGSLNVVMTNNNLIDYYH